LSRFRHLEKNDEYSGCRRVERSAFGAMARTLAVGQATLGYETQPCRLQRVCGVELWQRGRATRGGEISGKNDFVDYAGPL
jgi:hypothetical protein